MWVSECMRHFLCKTKRKKVGAIGRLVMLTETCEPSLLQYVSALVGGLQTQYRGRAHHLRDRGCDGEKEIIRRKKHGNVMFPLLQSRTRVWKKRERPIHTSEYSLS